jgi:hypothetical protein
MVVSLNQRAIIGLALVVAIGFCSGCIFDVRDAESPGGEGSTWVPPDVPATVFSNLETGLEDGTGVNYERSLHPNYTFIPLPEDASQFPPDVFEGWSVDDEKATLQKLLAGAAVISVRFITPTQTEGSATTARFRAPYELEVTDKQTPPVKTIYKGTAHFDFERTGSGWQLVGWEDIERKEGFATWGLLRGRLKEL